jgi:hypothetical protein
MQSCVVKPRQGTDPKKLGNDFFAHFAPVQLRCSDCRLGLLAAVSRIAAILANDLAPTNMNGPLLPLVGRSDAAPQLRQTGHSSTLRHFRRVKVGWAGLSCHWLRSEDLESNLRQNGSPGGLWPYYVPIISAAVRCYSLVNSSIISE